jgi:aldehyde dehydrogenase (NAD+)
MVVTSPKSRQRCNYLYTFQIHAELRAGFRSGKLKSIAYRKYQILQLGYLIKDNAKRISEALTADLGRPDFENQL